MALIKFHVKMSETGRAYPGDTKGFISPKLPKLDFTADAEYVAHLVNVSVVV